MSEQNKKLLKRLTTLAGIGFLVGILFIISIIWYFAKDLPDFNSIADYRPKLITKVYSHDNILVSEYAKEKRIYVKLEDIPEKLVKTLLATEDAKFYEHFGFDIKGITRAFIKNVFFGSREGASTITQQLVKNLLLTNERTYTRKIKEIILSYKIESSFSKNEILELYLNHIYLGAGSYGVMQAGLTYFNKSLDELSNGQIATIVGLPKAPNGYNPLRHPKKARFRRDVVLLRMLNTGIITKHEYEQGINADLQLNPRKKFYGQKAPDFSEHVRRIIKEKYGEKSLYKDGMHVTTTLDLNLQEAAQKAVTNGVIKYDRRHGYRGPLGKIIFKDNWNKRVDQLYKTNPSLKAIGRVAYVNYIDEENKLTYIMLDDETRGIIPFKELKWARKYISADKKDKIVRKVRDVYEENDIILVKKIDGMGPSINEQGEQTPYYSLQQLPKVQSALVAIDVKTGAVKAMVGGFDKLGTFNRAVQAKRQVGSSFKPFVYATAIENGYKTNSILLDAPIILRKQELDKTWKPQNYSQKVYGPSTLRLGLEKSRNLMTIRLARKIGISNIIKFAKRLGIPTENLEPNLSTALGSAAIPLIDMVSAYTIFANGGVHNKPFFIETIQNFNGETIYKNGPDCSNCRIDSNFETVPEEIENIQTQGQQIISENLAYIITDLMQGVVKRGTGWRAKKLGIPVAIKTGTTNDFIDSWYVGFTPELAVGVWSGFDNPQIMGNNETGSAVSGPTWVEFMQEAKKHYPNSNFKIPEDIVFVKVDKKTGQLPTKETKHTLLEVFENGSQPNAEKTDLMLEDESINILDGIY